MTNQNKKELIITRVFDASREKVWKAWTDSDVFVKWWGPKDFTSPVAKMDFRVGGKYLNCMRGAAGPDVPVRDYWSTGVYREIVPMERLVMTDSFADEKGKVVQAAHYGMSKDFPMEMLITVVFEEVEKNKTKLVLRHEGMPASDSEGARQGWSQSFDKLADILEKEE